MVGNGTRIIVIIAYIATRLDSRVPAYTRPWAKASETRTLYNFIELMYFRSFDDADRVFVYTMV